MSTSGRLARASDCGRVPAPCSAADGGASLTEQSVRAPGAGRGDRQGGPAAADSVGFAAGLADNRAQCLRKQPCRHASTRTAARCQRLAAPTRADAARSVSPAVGLSPAVSAVAAVEHQLCMRTLIVDAVRCAAVALAELRYGCSAT
eukprot:366256-Chlamydomonas_euryale.AAC.20